jgi:hypothetical protein
MNGTTMNPGGMRIVTVYCCRAWPVVEHETVGTCGICCEVPVRDIIRELDEQDEGVR